MNDDYLWDKSGEPDAEVKDLEEILGVLRYQPRPLELPDDLPSRRRRSFKPLLAIAATLVLALLATGVWLALHDRKTQQTAVGGNNRTSLPDLPRTEPSQSPERNLNDQQAENRAGPAKPDGSSTIKPISHRRSQVSNQSIALRRQREEAAAAKEQLLLALRVASEKLSLAQRKAQGAGTPNQIRNQHRVG